MANVAKVLVFLSLCHLLLLNSAYSKCQKPFQCGNLTLEFPFSNIQDPGCGPIRVDGCDSLHPRILSESEERNVSYTILNNISANKFLIHDPYLQEWLDHRSCHTFRNMSLPKSPFISFSFSPNLTAFTCYDKNNQEIKEHVQHYESQNCRESTVYYKNPTSNDSSVGETNIPRSCDKIQLPKKPNPHTGDLYDLLTAEFTLELNVTEDCSKCFHDGGECFADIGTGFNCKKAKSQLKLILGVCGGVVLLLCIVITCIIWQRKKRIKTSYVHSRNMSLDPFSKSDMESGGFCFGIPIFSYKQLEEATNNFDPSNELGEGGFGTVYYGKLRDGREVAIKRLYEHNYRRVEQFMNEIKILTGLRHPNLVSLYGCTSRRSRELLLVYEYISNGTVADHLHGERAKEAPLTWPVRMSIAIETASALAYLHNSDIIHRDVKTNNILLDSNCRVKVADFGLSRLFPIDVTHISTAPQGTPGYVDPEYHQCYQLTDKSDVYSFGVVLIELISSMPAVDTNRNRQEINLANLALNRIQRSAFDELIDLSLGYSSDAEVARMTTSVAELAFRCLQLDKDLRPSMDEVVAFLNDIHGGEDCDFEVTKRANGNQTAPGKIPPNPESDDIVLLKIKNFQSSPVAVTDGWPSSGSIASSIG